MSASEKLKVISKKYIEGQVGLIICCFIIKVIKLTDANPQFKGKYIFESFYFPDNHKKSSQINSGSLYLYIMFARLFRPFWNKFKAPRALLTTSTILAYTLLKSNLKLESPPTEDNSDDNDESTIVKNIEQYIRHLKQTYVCQGKELHEGQKRAVYVKDHMDRERRIIITRYKGKLYAFLGSCPHQEPFDDEEADYSLLQSMVFNDKLYCPHHGCIFDIQSGSVEHGPSLNNLPIFKAEEDQGKVVLLYPSAIPSSIDPNATQRDVEDLRKVLILGGDDAATVGCINGLRQFGYQGQITVVKQDSSVFPYRKDYLHKKLLNLHLHDKKEAARQPKDDKTSKQSNKTNSTPEKKEGKKQDAQRKTEAQINKLIESQLEEKIYSKLKYYPDAWYDVMGVDLVFSQQAYRIINKQYYPYVTFADSTKLQFDALLVATGTLQKLPTIEGITTEEARDFKINLPQNVFCPLRSKEQHMRLNKFLNTNIIKSLLVMGYNIESLEFIQQLKKQFPEIKVTVIDNHKDSTVSEYFGPQLQKAIAKEYTGRGVDFFIKIREQLFYSNKFSHKNITKRALQMKKTSKVKQQLWKAAKNKPKTELLAQNSEEDLKLKYENSVAVRISEDVRINADGVVIFPNQFAGNTQYVKNGKYTDFEYFHNDRLAADTFGRTDNIRIFSAGLSSVNDYYILQKRLVTSDPNMAFQQGFNASLNMQAFRIPFTYVPYQKFDFFGKRLYYIGTKEFFDRVLTIGNIEDWDFVTIYALGNKVTAVSGSPSKTKQLAVLRQSFRINCMPSFEDLLSGYWSVQNLVNLLKKLNKSGCYKDIIFANRQNIHKKDLVWMERTPDAGFQNDRPIISEEFPSVEVGADGKLKQL